MPMTKNDKLTDATESDDGRPLPEYSTINMLVSLCVGINFIETWLNTLENIFCDIAVPIKIIRKNALNKFLLKIQLLFLNISRENIRNFQLILEVNDTLTKFLIQHLLKIIQG